MQVAMSSKKMKSLFKGLRSISTVFEGDKEEEMQIGNPTDVKHVAHIGWDGPSSDNSSVSAAPSWMSEFKSSPACGGEDDSSVKCQSENGGRSRDLPKLPKSARKTVSEKGSPTREINSDKSKRRTSKKGASRSKASSGGSESGQDEDSSWSQQSVGLPEVPKKSRRKKSREGSNGGSSRSSRSSRTSEVSDYMSDGSVRSMSQFDQDKDGF